jgi:hypothetical protein
MMLATHTSLVMCGTIGYASIAVTVRHSCRTPWLRPLSYASRISNNEAAMGQVRWEKGFHLAVTHRAPHTVCQCHELRHGDIERVRNERFVDLRMVPSHIHTLGHT